MKKALSVICIFSLLIGLAACAKNNSALTQLGSSSFYISLPEGYAEAKDDFDEDQVAFFHKDDNSLDFDVYQWAKAGKYTLEDEAEYFAAEYGTTAEEVALNDIVGMKYISLEEFDGTEYTVLNYMFDDEESIVELCFWTNNSETELSAVEDIISTITTNP